ncbi:glycoside hydrolase family 13 protein [Pseudolysinimonas sp.]|uniref:glycoside hydrolase family 13 protein n=1 Tax=Pseudolysinimonas sp. TaxID=2680009 RepID=UPI003F7D686F
MTEARDASWWRDAVVYQIYPRSFADGDGDGVGDLRGALQHIDHLARLGVDAIWLSPFYVSPQRDAGYDVADYTDVDPLFGTLDDFDALATAAHAAGIRVIVDIVANHSSDRHPWFQAALEAGPGSPERARYLFRAGRGEQGELPPNNWVSVFGGPAWERVPDGEWYLHLFDATQPDFDWSNPEVAEFFDDVLRFWLLRGVDGFRVDVAHGFVKADGLPDHDYERFPRGSGADRGPMWDQDGVHDVYRRWRRVLQEFGDDRILVAEAWVGPAERMAAYVRPDEMQQSFNFPYLRAGWSAPRLRAVIDEALAANATVGATTTWVLSNHDVVRHSSRLGLADLETWMHGVGPSDPQPDEELGLRRARALTLFSMGLPGSMYLYQGEELGLPDHTTLPDELRQDPSWFRDAGATAGRDGARIPLPWVGDAPGYGFGPSGATWLPQPPSYAALAADRQEGDPASTLAMYRAAIRLRHEHGLGHGSVEWRELGPDVLAFRSDGVLVALHLGSEPVTLPAGEVLLASDDRAVADGSLRPDGAVWIRATS